jgi:putative ABC transport system substrate-binding protein
LIAAFKDGLRKLGWTEGQNIRIEVRWPEADADRIRAYAAELVNLQSDVIVAAATSALAPLTQATRTIPIVFVQVSDPVRGGFVKSLVHPEGNVTGFALYEYAIAVKWLELLKQIAPRVTRVAVIYDPTLMTNAGQLPESRRQHHRSACKHLPLPCAMPPRSSALSKNSHRRRTVA